MFDQRIENLKKILRKKNLDGILVSNVSNIFYLSGINFFDPIEREGLLLITRKQKFIITDERYSQATKKVKEFKLLEISSQNNLVKTLQKTAKSYGLKKVGFEENNLSVGEYKNISKTFKLSPANSLIENLRKIKDKKEIEKITKACEITDKAFTFIQGELKTGITEKDISERLKSFFKIHESTFSFEPIVAFGPNSSFPHHKTGNTKLRKNQIVLMDFGVKFDDYCSDFTRTVFVGKADERFKKMYNAVLEGQTKAFEYLGKNKPKLSLTDKKAREYIISQDFPSIPHSLGHGIGIDVHESPRLSPTSKDLAQNNTIFSLEPGIYIPGFGGVRIEDLVLYQNGPKFITHSNRNLIEL